MGWTVGRAHRFGVAGMILAAAALIFSGSGFLAAVGLGLVVASGVAAWGLGAPRGRVTRVLVHGLTFVGLLGSLAVFPSRRVDAVIAILGLGVMNRAALHAGRRDDFVLLASTAVMVAIGTTITPGLAFLPLFLLFFASSLLMLIGGHVRALAGGVAQAQLAARPLPVALGKLFGGALALSLAGYAVVSVLPQHHLGSWLSPGYFSRLPGASDVMRLDAGGAGGRQDRTVVLRVQPVGSLPLSALSGLYARMYSLEDYAGGRFQAGANDPGFPLLSPAQFDQPPGPATVELSVKRQVNRWLPQPLVSLGRRRPARPFVWQARQRLSGSWVARWRLSDNSLRYRVDLGQPIQLATPPKPFVGKPRARALALPADLDPRVRALAAELTAEAEGPAAAIAAVQAHFRRGFRYSLEPLAGQAEDPLARFLFEAKAGHCELYAAAVVVLLRAAGVPARVNTGYFGGRLNEAAGMLEYTQQDAHAWAEVYDPATGWRFVDATPAQGRTRRAAAEDSWLLGLIDAAEALWFNKVVDFDDRSRRALVRGWLRGLGRWLQGAGSPDPAPGGAPRPAPGARLRWLVLPSTLVLATILLWLRRRRDPARLGRRLRRALGEAGALRPLPLLLPDQPPERRALAEAAVRSYQALRFSAHPPPLPLVRAHIRALERARPRRAG